MNAALPLALASLAAALAGLPASAAGPARLEARFVAAHEDLDRGQDDWREAGARFQWDWERGRSAFVGVRRTQRFGERDAEGAAGFSVPLAPGWVAALEASGATSGGALPEWAALATIQRELGGGWVASGGLRRAGYASSTVSGASASLERYLGAWRLAWTAFLSRPDGGARSPVHRLTATWYGEGLTRVEAGFARGRESEFVPGLGLLTDDIRNATLSAAIEIARGWALAVDFEHQRQGDRYTRQAIRLGARASF